MAKPKPKPDDEEQSKRFIEKTKEVADEDAERLFEQAIIKIVPPKKKRQKHR